jgi:hypothetical protein
MRTNSGSGKSKNNYHDPTIKEHEEVRRERGSPPPHGRAEAAADAEPGQRQRAETGPAD